MYVSIVASLDIQQSAFRCQYFQIYLVGTMRTQANTGLICASDGVKSAARIVMAQIHIHQHNTVKSLLPAVG